MRKQNTRWTAYAILNAFGDIWTLEIFKTDKEARDYLANSKFIGLDKHTITQVEVKLKII